MEKFSITRTFNLVKPMNSNEALNAAYIVGSINLYEPKDGFEIMFSDNTMGG